MPQNLTEITVNFPSNSKPPRSILPRIFAFAPNRDTLGGTAYFIVNNTGNILLDCPVWQDVNREFLLARGGIRWLILTHRGGIGKQISQIQAELQCQIILQEQESYLLPELKVTNFRNSLSLSPEIELIWTPGHSPGSSCLYLQEQGGILFTGRHLLPKSPQEIAPLHTAKTFHWWRQINSIKKLRDRFSEENLKYILPGANTGYLRRQGYVDDAYQKLQGLDLS